MANESTENELNEYADALQYTCAAGTEILKGTLLEISADNTVLTSSGANPYAGVAAMDKDSTDSSTTISVHVPNSNNKFNMKCGAVGVTRGALVSLEGVNTIKDATAGEILSGGIIGRAMETGAAAAVVVVLS